MRIAIPTVGCAYAIRQQSHSIRQGYKRTVLHGIENCYLINRDRTTPTYYCSSPFS
ncbi:hypothetical protein [Nostoc sp. 'Peltigera membranacea cyanobiont' 210A]|uniref:hypothetical protein n=1 Tax=Nostoc sp. 'Peltigera membranacea cyanobiont' 210A TaxID=2014529 RepID=UPI00167E9FB2|nr:hypothetical protein [Nostoc sp. 'Peltigera membranacea cyanobiont' 210A]